MRNIIHKQMSLVEPQIDHEHSRELKEMAGVLANHPEIFELVHADLVRNLKHPGQGREGLMSAEQVLKALLIKQMNEFSYRLLAFHLCDSRSYRTFCGFGIADQTPSGSVLQRDIKRIRAATMERINRALLGDALAGKIEKRRKVRVDCTVVESNIHHPTDSSLLYDGVRVYAAFEAETARRLAQRLDIHYTPKHGSWLNVAECELSAMSRQCLSRRIDEIEIVRRETKIWEKNRNKNQIGVDWRFTTADARIKLKRLYPQIIET